MRRIRETVQCGVPEDRIIEESQPFVDATVAGEGEAAASVALDDEFVQILTLLCAQASQPKVVDDQKIRCQEPTERLLEGVVHAPARAP